MEVLCARPAINPSLPIEKVNIAKNDYHLINSINPNSLRKFGERVEKCLVERGVDRPTMGDVL